MPAAGCSCRGGPLAWCHVLIPDVRKSCYTHRQREIQRELHESVVARLNDKSSHVWRLLSVSHEISHAHAFGWLGGVTVRPWLHVK